MYIIRLDEYRKLRNGAGAIDNQIRNGAVDNTGRSIAAANLAASVQITDIDFLPRDTAV